MKNYKNGIEMSPYETGREEALSELAYSFVKFFAFLGVIIVFLLIALVFSKVTRAEPPQLTAYDIQVFPSEAFHLGYDLDDIAQFTKTYEGYSDCAYPDLGGGWSIGYGTVSYEGECISEQEAYNRLKYVLEASTNIVHGYTGVIPQEHMTALADTVYNVRPQNYDYVLRQYHHENRKKELTFALSQMACAWSDDKCVRHGGLENRFLARINLLFN